MPPQAGGPEVTEAGTTVIKPGCLQHGGVFPPGHARSIIRRLHTLVHLVLVYAF